MSLMLKVIYSNSEEETKKYAKEFASTLKGNETIILIGDLRFR